MLLNPSKDKLEQVVKYRDPRSCPRRDVINDAIDLQHVSPAPYLHKGKSGTSACIDMRS